MEGGSVYNFSDRLHQEGEWYNGFQRHNTDTSSFRHKKLQYLRERAVTLHQYQTFTQDVVCGVMFWLPGENKEGREIRCDANAQLRFFIAGGVEIPHFGLRLRLKYTDPENHKSEEYLTLNMIWTAWDSQRFAKRSTTTNPATSRIPEEHSFSARLNQASLIPITLTEKQAVICQGTAGADGCQVRWACDVRPYTYGLSIGNSPMAMFSEAQKASFDLFKMVTKADRLKVFGRNRPAALTGNWDTLKAMPDITFAPYPLYDCRWHNQEKRFERIMEIPGIRGHGPVELHHRKRDEGWAHVKARGACFAKEFEIRDMTPNPPITFINEREYQAIRSIGLLREVSACENRYNRQFNREYTFDMAPASAVERDVTSSSDDVFYVAFAIEPRLEPNIDMEQNLQLPAVGTPITITPTTHRSEKATEPDWNWPKPKPSKHSGTMVLSKSTKTELPFLPSRTPGQGIVARRAATPKSPSGESSQRSVARREDSSIPKTSDSFNTSKSPKVPQWKGHVISASLADIRNLNPPPNLVFAKIYRPYDDLAKGRVLSMTGRVQFGLPNSPRAAAMKAIQNVLWGNHGLGIPRENKMKKLLLAQENHVMKFSTVKPSVRDTKIPAFLNWLGDSRNLLQKEAIQEALSPQGSFLKLITGPPGTGKTAVSTAIIEYCYGEKLPLLVICGQNQGLDVVAQRWCSAYKHPNMAGVFRLGTEFAESVDNHFRDDQKLTTARVPGLRDSFRQAVRDLTEGNIAERIIKCIELSLTAMGANMDHLSLGRFIMSRVKDTVRTQNAPQEQSAEAELLIEFACWQQVLRKMDMFQVEPINPTGQGPRLLPQIQQELQDGFQKLWGKLQEFYLTEARVVFCTANTASRKILRGFKPRFLLIEEASTIPETLCLVPILENFASLTRVILSGDPAQLPPTVISRSLNECFQAVQLSLFERMILSGHPDTQMRVQYRMMGGICKFVSREFYKGTLQTVESEGNRATSRTISSFMSGRYQCSPGSSFFISVNGSSLLRRKGGTSVFNPHYVSHIGNLITALHKRVPTLAPKDILVLSYYDEERRILSDLLRKLGHSKVSVRSVDSSQGSESPVVILSTTRPGGEYGLGFLTDRKRSCVALSRAQSCLVIIGFQGMAASGQGGGPHVTASQGQMVWDRLVKQHKETRTFYHEEGSSRLVEEELGIHEGRGGYERALRS